MNRKVFPYFNGAENVWGDPVHIQRQLAHALGDVEKALRQCSAEVRDESGALLGSHDPDTVLQANNSLLAAVREVFEMVPFDRATGQGAVEDDCYAAINAFLEFRSQKKTLPESLPTSFPCTVPLSSEALDCPGIWSSDSGSISSESGSAT